MIKRGSVILILWAISTLACSFFSSLQSQETPSIVDEEATASIETTNLPSVVPSAIQSTQEPIPTIEPSEIQSTQEPIPTSSPDSPTSPAVRIVSIHTNSNISLAIDDQGRVWQWGNYQAGPNNSPCKGGDACLLAPALVPNLSDVVAISAGFTHRMALKSDGSLWGWGQNEVYQLGLGYGDKEYYDEAVPVPGMVEVVAVSAGGDFTVALKRDGTLWAWGKDNAGQLGNGMDSYTPGYALRQESPGQVVNLSEVVAVDTGWHHGIALRSDGTVWTWGFNQLGELGLGNADNDQHPIPAQVPGLVDVTVVSGGFTNSMVQIKDGSVWAWGGNLGGQLDPDKIGGPQPYPNPILIDEFAGVIQFDACSMQLVALKADGTVWILGFGEIGSLSFFPQGQTPLKDIFAVSCAEDHMLALDKYGVVWAWGNNNVGQLGNGTIEASPSPQPVIFP